MPFAFPSPFYPIIDPDAQGPWSIPELAETFLSAGARILQLRAKSLSTRGTLDAARSLRELTQARGVLLIINDRADIAARTGADGVHLGQDDLPPQVARQILGPGKIIGLSTHDLAQANEAARDPHVDYVAFGPIFATSSKRDPSPVRGLEALPPVRAVVRRPLVAIGGITPETALTVLAHGADAVALIGAWTKGATTREELSRHVRDILTSVRPKG